jgi:mannose/fructose/N-acetylgalactosamine-specific phosphotransferase system component IIC
MDKLKNLTNAPKGNRKQAVNNATMLFLLIGFIIAAWMKVDFNLYLTYALGCVGGSGAFMWANTKVHQTSSEKPIE